MTEITQKIYHIVSRIPKGYVATYKMIAELAGLTNPRVVGNALHMNRNPVTVPCHRVVHKDGSLSEGYALGGLTKQKRRLKNEGIKFIGRKVNLAKCLWKPA